MLAPDDIGIPSVILGDLTYNSIARIGFIKTITDRINGSLRVAGGKLEFPKAAIGQKETAVGLFAVSLFQRTRESNFFGGLDSRESGSGARRRI